MASTEVIEFLQQFKCGFVDFLFRFITFFGEEVFFVALFAIIFWCFSKTKAFDILITFMISLAANIGLKTLIDAPRPPMELRDPKTMGSATSSSFPSGHSSAASNYMFSTTSAFFRTKWWAILVSTIGALLVALSRLYLGHHYLKDVLAGVLIGGFIGYFSIIILEKIKINSIYWTIVLIPVYILMILLDNSEIYIVAGGLTAVLFGYTIEKLYIKMEIPKNFIVKIVRAVIGIGLLYLIYFVTSLFNGAPLALILGSFMAGAFITVLAPLLFRATDKLVYLIIDKVKSRKNENKEDQEVEEQNKEEIQVGTNE